MSVTRNFMLSFSAVLVTAGSACAEAVAEYAEPVAEPIEAVAHEAAHGKSGLPQFDVTTWPSQIFWLAIAFAVLYLVFAKSLLPSISSTLTNRKNHIGTHLSDAELLTYQAKDIEDQVTLAMKNAAHKASDALHAAENEAKARLAASLSDFRVRYEREIDTAETRIEVAKVEAMQDMQRVVAELASQMANKVAGLKTDVSHAETVVQSLSGKSRKAA